MPALDAQATIKRGTADVRVGAKCGHPVGGGTANQANLIAGILP
jgi:hypothetical protein